MIVDDYDLVATQQNSPVALMQPLIAQARDVGLHLVVARRSGGASRALYEPVIQSLRDLAQPGLLLSGSPDEGPLLGNVRPTPQPAGRGRLITRDRGVEALQMAWTDPIVVSWLRLRYALRGSGLAVRATSTNADARDGRVGRAASVGEAVSSHSTCACAPRAR